jgi:1-acyl-sn-glycerol-3-phosphate acyltransferase
MYKTINHVWRIFATGFCFALFGIGGVVLSITILPLQKLLIKNDKKQRAAARRTVHHSFRFFVNTMQGLGVFKVKIDGADKLKQLKGNIIIANHPSLVDVVVLVSQIKNADCVVKSHLFKNPFMRGVLRASGYISNSEPEQLIEDCAASLKAGNNIVIFPEGTRTDKNKPLKLQRGFANIAMRSQSDLLFILLQVTPSTLTKDNVWYNVPERRFDFNMQVKETILISDYCDEFNDGVTKAVRQLTRHVETLFKQELTFNG